MEKIMGNHIRLLREKNDITKNEMANKIGISKENYQSIENGERKITLELLSKISKLLNIEIKDITNILVENENSDNRNLKENKIFDMLDLFYANKNLYDKIKKES